VLKIKGKSFAKGAKVSFSNPGVRALETTVKKDSELAVSIQVDPNAAVGTTSLFVVNPDDSEVEASFEIAEGTPTPAASAPSPARPESETPSSQPRSSDRTSSATNQQFEVFNLGEVAGILQRQQKAEGVLTLIGKELKYAEEGKEIFSASRGEIKEIGPNSLLGVNTGTFHIILNSGKRYNFIARSLRPTDGQTILDTLRQALL